MSCIANGALLAIFPVKTCRVRTSERTIGTIGIPVHTIAVPAWVGLQEPARIRIIVPCPVVVKTYFYIVPSSCEHVWVGVVGVFYGWFAEYRVFVRLYGVAAAVAKRNNAAECVVVVVVCGVAVSDLDHADRLVDTGAVDVLSQQVVVAVVFGYHLGAVIYVPCCVAVDDLLASPAGHVMFVFDFLPVIRVRHGAVARPLYEVDPAAVFTVAAAVVFVDPL